MPRMIQDLKHGLRVLRKSPGFTTTAVLVLALGIGANTAIFTVVNAVLLRPLPFEDPERLVYVWHVPPPKSFPGMSTFSVSAANYIDWRRQNHAFEKMAIFSGSSVNLTGSGKPEYLQAATVSADFFSVLGARPMLGRTFVAGEDEIGHDHEVVLAHGFWQSRFGGDQDIVGRQITLNGEAYTVIGVMGPKFVFPSWGKNLWLPLAWTAKEAAVRGEHHSVVIARLRREVNLKQAQGEMTAISERLARQYPEDDKDWGALVIPVREDMVGDVRPALLVLLGAVAFVLLIACANVANLLLSRALARSKEIAIRTALGASRARLLQQLLLETVLLALAGGAAGLVVANFGVDLIVHFLAQQLPRSMEITIDSPVLGFTFLISLLTGIVAGIVPAWRLSKSDVNETLKQGLGRVGSAGGNRTRAALVVCEVALSLMLLAGAGLMIRSLWNLRRADPGFDPHNVLTMSLPIPGTKFPTPGQEIDFWARTLERIRALPGVEAAGAIDDLPLDGGGSHQPIAIEGRPALVMSEQPEVDVRAISTGYFRALHIPVIRGRDFTDADTADRPDAVVISEAMAKRFWPGEDALGKRLTLTFFPGKIREVVGVVGDVKLDGLDQTAQNSALYVPLTQISVPANGEWRSFGLDLVLRSTTSADLGPVAIRAIHEIDPEQAVLHNMTLEQYLTESIAPQRFNMLLLAAFAALALLLATMGIYSVLSYAVRRRVREIGIRMALGAQIRDVLRLIIYEGMKPALLGLSIGVAGALLLGQVLAKLVFGVKTTDPATFVAASVLLAGVAFLATLVPAYRATRVDPMRILREE